MQVKVIHGDSIPDFEEKLNAFLDTIDGEPNIKYDFSEMTAAVEYSKPEPSGLCCDCRFWDDNGDNLIGLCHRCGGRKRFSDKACKNFIDVRGE